MHTDLIYGNYGNALARHTHAPHDREAFSFSGDSEVGDGGRGAESIVDALDASALLLAQAETLAKILPALTHSQRVLCILTLFCHKSSRECQKILGISKRCLNKRLSAIEGKLRVKSEELRVVFRTL